MQNTTETESPSVLYAQLAAKLKGQAQMQLVINKHIEKKTGHVDLLSWFSNGSSDEDKVTMLKNLLECIAKAPAMVKPVEVAVKPREVKPVVQPDIVPPPVETEVEADEVAEAVKAAIAPFMARRKAEVDIEQVTAIVRGEVRSLGEKLNEQVATYGNEIQAYLAKIPPRDVVEIRKFDGTVKEVSGTHRQFKDCLDVLLSGDNLAMIGPAGSGKTTLGDQLAKALDVPFFFTGAINSEYKLTGFIDAQGRVISTAFRKAYETGGLFLFDEMDASMPQAVLAFNAALANGHMDFPDGAVKRHAGFYCAAAANTFWNGADRVYVGRNQLDGASMDRFSFLELDYDEDLERRLATNDKWVDRVQSVRQAVKKLKLRHIVSPRASIFGARLLAQGVTWEKVESLRLWKGLDTETINKIKANE